MLTKFLNNYGFMILGGAMIICSSAFKGAEMYAGKKLAPVTIYFHGDEKDATQVASAFRWTTTPNGESCSPSATDKACSALIDNSDLTSTLSLDSTKIFMNATPGGAGATVGYVPIRTGGPSSNPFSPSNRN